MEKIDLSKNPEQAQRVKQMKQELDDWMRSVIRSINGKDYQALK